MSKHNTTAYSTDFKVISGDRMDFEKQLNTLIKENYEPDMATYKVFLDDTKYSRLCYTVILTKLVAPVDNLSITPEN